MTDEAMIDVLKKDGLYDDFSFRLSPNEAFAEAFNLNLTPDWNFWNEASNQMGWGDFHSIKDAPN